MADRRNETPVTSLNGMQVIERRKDVLFLRIPEALQLPCGECTCPECKGELAYWDTLAIAVNGPSIGKIGSDYAYTVHMPKGRGVVR